MLSHQYKGMMQATKSVPHLTPTTDTRYHSPVKYSNAYHNSVELQRLLMGDARDAELKPLVRAGIARAFVELEMLKLRIRMKPAPKPIDTTKTPPKTKRAKGESAFSEKAEGIS